MYYTPSATQRDGSSPLHLIDMAAAERVWDGHPAFSAGLGATLIAGVPMSRTETSARLGTLHRDVILVIWMAF